MFTKGQKLTKEQRTRISQAMLESYRRRREARLAAARSNDRPVVKQRTREPLITPSALADTIRKELQQLDEQIALAQTNRGELLQAVEDLLREFTSEATLIQTEVSRSNGNTDNGQNTAVEDCRLCS